MSTSRVNLEEFDLGKKQENISQKGAMIDEAVRLKLFEDGYEAGWKDSMASVQNENKQLVADLEGHIRKLSFSFHEARAHVLGGIEPLIKEVVCRMLPKFTHALLPHLILDRLNGLIEDKCERPVRLLVSPASRIILEAIMPFDLELPVVLVDDADLEDGQVIFEIGSEEELIDASATLQRVEEMLGEFFHLNRLGKDVE